MNKKLARRKRHKFQKRVDQNAREITKVQTWNKARLEIEKQNLHILDEKEHSLFVMVKSADLITATCMVCGESISETGPNELFVFTTVDLVRGNKYFTHVKHFYTEGKPEPESFNLMLLVKNRIVEVEIFNKCGLRIGVDFARPETMQKDRNEEQRV